jgi:gas vesicle protein
MNERSSELGSFLAGFVIGGLVGAAVALILAPQSGSATRAQIGDKGAELRTSGKERARQVRSVISEQAEDMASQAREAGQRIEERARIVLDSGRTTTSDQLDRAGSESLNELTNGDAPAGVNGDITG